MLRQKSVPLELRPEQLLVEQAVLTEELVAAGRRLCVQVDDAASREEGECVDVPGDVPRAVGEVAESVLRYHVNRDAGPAVAQFLAGEEHRLPPLELLLGGDDGLLIQVPRDLAVFRGVQQQ